MGLIVLYDACVLYPAPIRDLLMRLAIAKLFQARWSEAIHDSVEAIHPDDFLAGLWAESPDAVLDAVRRQREGLKNPPKSAGELLDTLEQCGLPKTVALLRPHEGQV